MPMHDFEDLSHKESIRALTVAALTLLMLRDYTTKPTVLRLRCPRAPRSAGDEGYRLRAPQLKANSI